MALAADLDVISLGAPGTYVIPCPYRLDGRVSTHPRGAVGFAPLNCYVIIERHEALLIDTGFTIHRARLLRALDVILPSSVTLSILPSSIGELRSVSNVQAVTERYPVTRLYGNQTDPAAWVKFLSRGGGYSGPAESSPVVALEGRTVRGATKINVDATGGRVLDSVTAPLQLLPASWRYDKRSRTLFTADVFTHVSCDGENGPWVVDDLAATPSVERVYDHMVNSRYWWLPGSDTQSIVQEIDAVFARFDVEVLAPAFGCVLHGKRVVRRHYETVREVLELAAARPSIGVSAGLWS